MGTATGPLMGQGSTTDTRAPKRYRLVRIIDEEEEEEEEEASTLVCRPRSCPDVTPSDAGRVAEDPPAAHVEQA